MYGAHALSKTKKIAHARCQHAASRAFCAGGTLAPAEHIVTVGVRVTLAQLDQSWGQVGKGICWQDESLDDGWRQRRQHSMQIKRQAPGTK
eukprot:366474-Chlamydomonas_euryale.AAC.33